MPISRFRIQRRQFLRQAGATLLVGVLPPRLLQAYDSSFKSNPFSLGVASGYPTSDGIILWTRLLLRRDDGSDALADTAIPVALQIATDEAMKAIVHKSEHVATSEWAHSIHAEVKGLKPGRDYWYRFTAGGMQSRIGRTRTAPAATDKPERLRVAVACCQKYENGYFVAYRHLLDDSPDLIVHVGDYIYEYGSSAGGNNVRGDNSGETHTLTDYRQRHALYKADADLQAAHAAHPWLLTWDDHEVTNDYAGDSTYDASGESVLRRRAASYRAYYEHMPLPRSARPNGASMRLYADITYGNLVQIQMLDTRQYRSPLGCLGESDTGGPGAHCAALFNESRTKIGKEQEAWLTRSLAGTKARWNVIAQGTPMAHVDLDYGPDVAYRRDAWDGYPAARQRVLDMLANHKVSNPIVVDGDIHAFQVANLNRYANKLDSPIIASEFTADSITSGGGGPGRLEQNRLNNPNLLFNDNRLRGYLTLEFSTKELRANLVNVESITQPDAGRSLLASFVVEHGKAGPVKA
ncbi:MAG TPA: alkaline phosphatase D family protein [Steroidobacteraceae bacterium]|nr:alkaline phosphatase D family protein [Steroidobacteraceae bacterium]